MIFIKKRKATCISLSLLMFLSLVIGAESDEKIDKLATECQQGKEKSCQALVAIAKDQKKPLNIRRAAVDKIVSQTALADIAMATTDFERQLIVNGVVDNTKDFSE